MADTEKNPFDELDAEIAPSARLKHNDPLLKDGDTESLIGERRFGISFKDNRRTATDPATANIGGNSLDIGAEFGDDAGQPWNEIVKKAKAEYLEAAARELEAKPPATDETQTGELAGLSEDEIESVRVAEQFVKETSDYQVTPENYAGLMNFLNKHELPFTLDNLQVAWAHIKETAQPHTRPASSTGLSDRSSARQPAQESVIAEAERRMREAPSSEEATRIFNETRHRLTGAPARHVDSADLLDF